MDTRRYSHLIKQLNDSELDAIALIPGASLYHLTGLSFHLMERPIVLLVYAESPPALILPELEAERAQAMPFDVKLFTYGEDDTSRQLAFEQATAPFSNKEMGIGMEPLRMRVHELYLLARVASQWNFTNGTKLLSSLRLYKDSDEQELIRTAVRTAETALEKTLPMIHTGMTERELAGLLTVEILKAGSDPDLPFEPIVASGPNSAMPHATPSERKLQAGDLLLLDWGARMEGYVSDLTRTFRISECDPEFEKIYAVVRDANRTAFDAVRPGVPCGKIDQAARDVIEQAGYGEWFIHRTGHGFGLEAHEPPYIRSGEEVLLEEGMTFTIEPGIYLPGKGGIRIEDNVLVTGSGGECLSTFPREFEVLG
jgi:Xaa-Pro dipeptidase